MQNDAQRLSINLGRKQGSDPTSLFIKWTVNTGRIIIVVVELLTLAALGYRFIIDRQIVDLHDQIEKTQIFVNAQAKNEIVYRNLQDRLNSIQILQDATERKVVFLRDLITYLNNEEFISSTLNVAENTVSIDGQTYSIFTLNGLVAKLRENPDVVSISIDELTTLDQGVRFKVNTKLVEPKVAL